MFYQAVPLHYFSINIRLITLCYFAVSLLLYFSNTYSYAEPAKSSPDNSVQRKSAQHWLDEAQQLRQQDRNASILTAEKALTSAQQANNILLLAKSNMLLGALYKEKKKYNQSLDYFQQAAEYFKRAEIADQFVIAQIEYIRILIINKEFELALQLLKQLQQTTEQYGQDQLIALTLVTKGDLFYKKKQFKHANEHYIASLKYQHASDKSGLKTRGQTYKMLAQSYKRLKDKQQTAFYYQKALQDFTDLGEKKLIARTLSTLAEAERKLGRNMQALEYSTQSLAMHEQINDPGGYAKALTGAGIIYRHIGLYEKSLEFVYEAHQYYLQQDMIKDVAKTSNQMGLIYSRLKQYELAKSFYQLTVNLPEKKLDSKTLASALRELAIISLSEDDFEYAKENAYKALAIYEKQKSLTKASTVARIIANIYREQGNVDKAIYFYTQSLEYAKRAKSKLYQVKAQVPLAAMLIELDNEKAINLLLESVQLAKSLNDTLQRLYAYRELRKAEKVRDNFAASLFYAEKEIVLTNALQEEKEQQEVARIKAKLHSYKMEMEVIALKENAKLAQLQLAQQNHDIKVAEQSQQISELKLSRNRYANFMLAALLVLCLSAVIYIYRLFKKSRRENRELDYLAARDPLTNCYNRRVLINTLEHDFTALSDEQEYSVILVDIDHFKAVNDNYGHNMGDEVLCGVARLLQSAVRQNDMIARYGGEEFCILLPNTNIDKALQSAENMRQLIENSAFEDVNVTCSFGVSSSRFNAQTSSELIQQADVALYQSKDNGRNRVTQWQP